MIDRRFRATELRAGTMDVDALLRAAAEITNGLSDDELKRMTATMNEEYVEPSDDKIAK
jgi:hypothetical protein